MARKAGCEHERCQCTRVVRIVWLISRLGKGCRQQIGAARMHGTKRCSGHTTVPLRCLTGCLACKP